MIPLIMVKYLKILELKGLRNVIFPSKIRDVPGAGRRGGGGGGGEWLEGLCLQLVFLLAIESILICARSYTELHLVQKSKTSSDH